MFQSRILQGVLDHKPSFLGDSLPLVCVSEKYSLQNCYFNVYFHIFLSCGEIINSIFYFSLQENTQDAVVLGIQWKINRIRFPTRELRSTAIHNIEKYTYLF